MTHEQLLLTAITRDPADGLAWLALADWLEDDGQQPRAELLRLTRRLRDVDWDDPARRGLEARLVGILQDGVRPAGPEFLDDTGLRFRLVPPGRFLMGAADDEAEDPDLAHYELPRREVTLTRAFWLAETPVTQRQYAAVLGSNPSHFCATGTGQAEVLRLDTGDLPVECVSWDEASAFCARLGWRLPTEAEWEYACRAGTTTRFNVGDALRPNLANFGGALGRPRTVASFPPNAFGLYDMHGNVVEWCADYLDEGYYEVAPAVDPPGPEGTPDTSRVFRGGSWTDLAGECASAYRDGYRARHGNRFTGSRPARTWTGSLLVS